MAGFRVAKNYIMRYYISINHLINQSHKHPELTCLSTLPLRISLGIDNMSDNTKPDLLSLVVFRPLTQFIMIQAC